MNVTGPILGPCTATLPLHLTPLLPTLLQNCMRFLSNAFLYGVLEMVPQNDENIKHVSGMGGNECKAKGMMECMLSRADRCTERLCDTCQSGLHRRGACRRSMLAFWRAFHLWPQDIEYLPSR